MNPIDLKPFFLAEEPTTKDDFNRWIRQDEAMSFLRDDINDDHILLYVSLPIFWSDRRYRG